MVAVAFKEDFTVHVEVYARDGTETSLSPLVLIYRPGQTTPIGIVTSEAFSNRKDAERCGYRMAESWLEDWAG